MRKRRVEKGAAAVATLVAAASVSAAGIQCVKAPCPQPAWVPLCPGLQVVTAIQQPNGDYESIKTVESANETTVRIRYASEQLVTDFLSADFGKVRKNTTWRSMRREDLASASIYQQRFFADMPETIPESTAIGVSAKVLAELKQQGKSELAISTAYSGEFPADRNVRPNVYDFQMSGALERATPGTVKLPVLLNGVRTELPAIHARADFGGDKAEFFILDDPANPLMLRFRVGIGAIAPMGKEQAEQCRTMKSAVPEMGDMLNAFCGRTEASDSETLNVVKIVHRCAVPTQTGAPGSAGAAAPGEGAQLEQALATSGKVEIYDIHFSFNSAEIREESLPRLAEIAAVLRRHPDWTLTVTGHTDGVGGDDANLKLSQRRAAAVKDALVRRHGVAANRLDTSGAGEAQPRDTNATVEGRARNRRVELIKR